MCIFCSMAGFRYFEGTPDEGVAEFVTSGGRWRDTGNSSGGFTTTLGTSGGVVAWSVAAAGLTNATGQGFFTDSTVDLGTFLPFDYQAELRRAFDAWASVANIEFIQVADGGGNIGIGTMPTIRVAGGFIDGQSGSNTLARAFFPSSSAAGGDVVFDNGNTSFFASAQNFFLTALHEIGHALGLNHEPSPPSGNVAIMNPFINTALTGLQADDINGIRTVYGAQDFGPNSYFMPASLANLTLIDAAPLLTIVGNGLSNVIIGSGAAETFQGAAGNDSIDGGAGADSARFFGVRAAYTVTALGGSTVRVVGPDGTDIVSNVEQLIFDDQVFTVNVVSGPMALNGSGGPDDLVGGPANDVISGFGGNDRLTGKGGADRLTGGSGADIFVFDASTLSDAQAGIFDRITDYDQGNSPRFVAGEGDQINLAAVVGTAFNGGQPAGLLVRAIREGIDGSSLLQVDSDGSANGTRWTTIARLDGVAAGEALNVVLSDSQPAGTTIVVQDVNSTTKVGNYDGDTHGDLLWRNTDGTVGIWLMDGPNITAPRNVAVISDDWHVAGIGDFGGDGKGDILWRNDSGLVGMWQLNGNAIAAAGDIMQVSSEWHVAGTGDFGGDGKSDILWRNDSGLVGVWQMNGTAIVSAANILQIDNNWHVAGTGDFNGDGKSDILWRNDNGVVGIWHMNGTAIASAENIPQIDPAWHIAGTGDFNGDGRSDILWRNDSGLVGMWQMNGSAVQSAHDILSVSLDWHIIGTGDFNGDSKADILWNSDDGTIGLWTMNGGAIQSATNIHTAPHDWTTVAHHWDLV